MKGNGMIERELSTEGEKRWERLISSVNRLRKFLELHAGQPLLEREIEIMQTHAWATILAEEEASYPEEQKDKEPKSMRMKTQAKTRAVRAIRQIIRAAGELKDIEESPRRATKRKASTAVKRAEGDARARRVAPEGKH